MPEIVVGDPNVPQLLLVTDALCRLSVADDSPDSVADCVSL